jgi:hypothetical protein
MTEQALRAALLKLQGKSPLPASQFTLHSAWPWINLPGKQVP